MIRVGVGDRLLRSARGKRVRRLVDCDAFRQRDIRDRQQPVRDKDRDQDCSTDENERNDCADDPRSEENIDADRDEEEGPEAVEDFAEAASVPAAEVQHQDDASEKRQDRAADEALLNYEEIEARRDDDDRPGAL